ncbi:MAG: hypothetical protein ABSH56_22340 [Bryobacteraceae bacterium]|jgi:hypothetical protein
MNVKEGMRRLGILLGACGAILGGCVGYSYADAQWVIRERHKTLETLTASPTMQKVAKVAKIAVASINQPGVSLEVGSRISAALATKLSDDALLNALSQASFLASRIADTQLWDYTDHEIAQYIEQRYAGKGSSGTPGDFLSDHRGPRWDRPNEGWRVWDAHIGAEGDAAGDIILLKAHPLLEGNHDRISSVHLDASSPNTVHLTTFS